ncbi:MAG: hypothetical protein ACHQ1G_07365 [Planctomycetota bacterium]
MRKKIPIATTSANPATIRLRASKVYARVRGKKLPEAYTFSEAGMRRLRGRPGR